MTKTRLYLDVDGVINAWFSDKAWEKQSSDQAHASNGTWTIVWAPAMVDALKALDLDLVWTTTWRAEAATVLAPMIGFGEDARFITAPAKFSSYGSIGWKGEAVENDQETDPSPFIWIDDEMGLYQIGLARELGGFAFGTDPNIGITPEQIEKMKGYINEHAV